MASEPFIGSLSRNLRKCMSVSRCGTFFPFSQIETVNRSGERAIHGLRLKLPTGVRQRLEATLASSTLTARRAWGNVGVG